MAAVPRKDFPSLTADVRTNCVVAMTTALAGFQYALLETLVTRTRLELTLAQVAVAVGVDAVEAFADAALHGSFAAADLLILVAIERFEYDFDVCGAAHRQIVGCC